MRMIAARTCNPLRLLSAFGVIILFVQTQYKASSAGANSISLGQAQNVSVYVYYPMRDRVNISALVVWDPPNIPVNSYTVSVVGMGLMLNVNGTRTSTTLDSRDRVNQLKYSIPVNRSCMATVSAGNTLYSVNFTTYAASPPTAVLAVLQGGAVVIGETRSSPSYANASLPLAVNAINREMYWYSSKQGMLLRSQFSGGKDQPLISTKGYELLKNASVTAMAYEWVGEKVYFVGNSSGQLTLWRVPIINPDGLERVTSLGPGTSVNSMIVDPFSGYMYWSDGSIGLKYVNLKKNMSYINGTTCVLNYAFTMDSGNGDLWLSTSNGDIVTCNVASRKSQVVVNATVLMASSGKNASGLGLPATSIALDEYRVYWTNAMSGGIFYAWRNDTSIANVLAAGVTPSAIFSISPGQQPLPPVECLSYNTTTVNLKPQGYPTSTSILFKWDVPALSENCQDIILDYATFSYVLDGRQSQQFAFGYPNSTLATQYLAQELIPFLEYCVVIFAYNQYTVAYKDFAYKPEFGGIVLNPPNAGDRSYCFSTLEGVPKAPTGLVVTRIGTHQISLSWDPIKERDLLGNLSLLVYYVQPLGSQSASSPIANYSLNGLNPATLYTIMVITSNGVYNSSAAIVNASTWPLPPTPVLINSTNTSIVVMVNVTSVLMTIITSYTVQANGRVYEMTSDPVKIFTLNDLKVFADYSISTVGTYVSNDKQTSQPLLVKTDFGVPDAPEIYIDGVLLKWMDIPSHYNGTVTRLRLFVAEPINTSWSITFDVHDQTNYYDLRGLPWESNGSSPSEYKATLCPAPSDVVGLAVGISAAITVCVIIVIFIGIGCCVALVRIRRKQAHANEDMEINHLRVYVGGQAAHNPQYTWSQDDYCCTEEEIQHLGNFPRQNLTLETFIDQGEFGEVYKGTAIDILGAGTGPLLVAVKTLHKGASPDEQRKFLGEAALMRNFDNPYIVKILGVCTDPIYIIMELMPGGDLLHFLREAKQNCGPALLTLKELIEISVDVAKGCCYLEQARFIHRDIAARNCLVSSKGADRVVKIGDFGLAKDLYSSDYYQVEGQRRLPVRWMAPEALLQGKFTLESDVWSYGVLLWEIMSLGNQPYPALTNQEVLHFVSRDGRLDKPERCPKKIYRIMQSCWSSDPTKRPCFSGILDDLNKYLDLMNTSGNSSGEESDDENMERRGTIKPEPQADKGISHASHQGSLKLQESPRYHEDTRISEDHTPNHRTINSKSGDSSSDERGPI